MTVARDIHTKSKEKHFTVIIINYVVIDTSYCVQYSETDEEGI